MTDLVRRMVCEFYGNYSHTYIPSQDDRTDMERALKAVLDDMREWVDAKGKEKRQYMGIERGFLDAYERDRLKKEGA